MNPKHIEWPKSGTYILAVSGGRDSMVLLDVFATIAKDKKYELVVAHFDHAMRSESAADATFVEAAAAKYNFKYEGGRTNESLNSEDAARLARYSFLYNVAKNNQAHGVITAHHENDLLETSLLNLARGSGRKGLVPFDSVQPLRPFKHISRTEIESYSDDQNIQWQEDSTNQDIANPRNFIRHKLLTHQHPGWSDHYLSLISSLRTTNESIDAELDKILISQRTKDGFSFPKSYVAKLSGSELAELLVKAIASSERPIEIDRRLIEELVIFAKIGKTGRHRPLREGWKMHISSGSVDLTMISIPATKS